MVCTMGSVGNPRAQIDRVHVEDGMFGEGRYLFNHWSILCFSSISALEKSLLGEEMDILTRIGIVSS